ncbi:MAG: NUDIX domain-containing protein [Phycisphaerales bacterium]|nr:NUDIX domain-containing protein [Phycisphaerales bacterium]
MTRDPDGYRRHPTPVGDAGPLPGPRLRSDVVDAYVFRRAGEGHAPIELLQLRRAKAPLDQTWQPVMGHVEAGETAVAAAARELLEEVGLDVRGPDAMGFWALEQVWPFFLAELDCIVLSPRFVAEAAPRWEPTLNHEHSASRWVRVTGPDDPALNQFMWPGQRHAIREIISDIARPDAHARDRLRVQPA